MNTPTQPIVTSWSPILPKVLNFWFQGCLECLGDTCDCAPTFNNAALVDRLAQGRQNAKMRREASKARLARARTFRKPSLNRRALQIQQAFRMSRARREVVCRRLLRMRELKLNVPTCSICGSTDQLDPGCESGWLVHLQGCPDGFREGLSCHCGKIFCRKIGVCRDEAIVKYRAEHGIVDR